MTDTNKNEFITTDLHFATAVMTSGLEVKEVRIDRAGNKINGVFVIDTSNADIDWISRSYYNGGMKVDAYAYRNNLKRLKTWATSVIARSGMVKNVIDKT